MAELAKRELARRHLLDFVSYNFAGYEANWHHKKLIEALESVEKGETKRLMVFMPPRHGKQCADSTPVFTPHGWVKHGDLNVGDYVFGIDGKPIKVLAKSEKTIANRRVMFSNGEFIDCHQNHEWTVFDRHYMKWKTYETDYMRSRSIKNKERKTFLLPKITALELNDKYMPMPPYVLGAWLGDGSSKAPIITHDAKDYAVIDEIKKSYSISSVNVHKKTGCLTTRFGSGSTRPSVFGDHLREIGVFNNKHIPEAYKYSSIKSRLELLAGIIDTDGNVDKNSRVRITTASKNLADDIYEVCVSLGFKPYTLSIKPTKSSSGIQGKKTIYVIGFNPNVDIPTKLSRKKIRRFPEERMIGIENITEIKGETGNCIQVDSPDGLYLVGKLMIPTHNSELCSIQFPAWVIGRDKDRNIIQASYSADLATDFGRQTRNLIASQEYQNVFPDTKLSEDSQAKGKWNTNGRGAYNAVGVGGATTGKGADFLIIDDPIKNRQDADSEVIRESQWGWYRSTARTRLSPEGAIILVLTRWHDDDLAGRILKGDNASLWKIIKFPAIAVEDEPNRKKGQALWANHFTLPILEETRRDLGSYEWSALYQQEPIDEESQEFKRGWFRKITAAEVEAKNTNKFITIDTAVSQSTSADYTAIIRNFVDADNRWNIRTWRGKISPLELIDMVFNLYQLDRPTKIGIEKTIYLQALKPFLDEEMRRRGIFLPIVELQHNSAHKQTRIRGLIPRYESGSINHVEGECRELEEELLRFPKAIHDDLADALAYQLQFDTGISAGKASVFVPRFSR